MVYNLLATHAMRRGSVMNVFIVHLYPRSGPEHPGVLIDDLRPSRGTRGTTLSPGGLELVLGVEGPEVALFPKGTSRLITTGRVRKR